MPDADDEFLERLRSAFRAEAAEHVQAMAAGLIDLEREPDAGRRQAVLSSVFREAHSLKGAARAVNAAGIEAICQALESVFAAWRRQPFEPRAELFDPLQRAVSALERAAGAGSGEMATIDRATEELIVQLGRLETAGAAVPMMPAPASAATEAVPPPLPAAPPPLTPQPPPIEVPPSPPSRDERPAAARRAPSDTLRISAAKLDALLLQAEELLAVKLTAAERAAELRALAESIEQWERTAAPRAADVRAGTGSRAESASARVRALVKVAEQDRRSTAAMIDALLEDAKRLLMLPFATVLELFPKLVRDLSRDQGKDVELTLRGGDVEIDKRILAEMKDPLIHLLRNSVDHGIEPPDRRATAGKPPRGRVGVTVAQVDGNAVEIVVSDDGAGVDPARVAGAAVRQGLIAPADAAGVTEGDALALIFRPDLSTSPVLTEVSGRGLGLSIVKEKVEQFGGRIVSESRPGTGTTFRLRLPLTLATFRGILVGVGDQVFVIPTANVERVLRVRRDEVITVENREAAHIDGQTVALARLADVLELTRPRATAAQGAAFLPVAVVAVGETRVGFVVDAVLDEQEVLVKRLGHPLVRVRNVAGATVLGDGRAVLILNAADLLKSAGRAGGAAVSPVSGAAATPDDAPAGGSVLVADDSITARMLIKNILESAGYAVTTAVDGLDALTALRTGTFDLLVSDVEMPRMDGFELTARVRTEARLAELPVVLVTALASREHREKGVDAGANAYIVKGSFDQSNLLDAVRRLL